MSWDSYVQSLMNNDKKCVEHVAICSNKVEELSVWAKSENFNIMMDELKVLLCDRSNFTVTGPIIGGQKCMLVSDQMDIPEVNYIKLKTKAQGNGKSQMVLVGMTYKALFVVVGKEKSQAADVVKVLFDMIQYLRGLGS